MIRVARKGPVAEVSLDRPPLHLLGREMVGALREAFERLASEAPSVVVLRCDGGGADVRELAGLDEGTGRDFISRLHEACVSIRALDAPVIAAIDGPCLGAHLEVAAACDMRIASRRSRLGMPEINVGIPSVIDAWWIVRLAGLGSAASLFFDGDAVEAEEAHRIGLIDRLAEDGRLEADALEWAARIARHSPIALAQQKRVLRDWTDEAYRAAARASIERFAATFRSPEAHEAMRAMLEKRKPRF